MDLTLTLSHIWKSYSGKAVLRDISLSFESEGTYVLMGPNGSGKSTLLRICALLESPDRGEVVYRSGDSILEKNMGLRRRITLVLPRVGIFSASVFDNVAYGLKIRGVNGCQRRNKVLQALESVGLDRQRGQHALTLSSGEAQRLGVARAMVMEPQVLFLDEPTASVDPESAKIVEELILTMKRQKKGIVVVATHDRGQADRLADRMLYLDHGTITIL